MRNKFAYYIIILILLSFVGCGKDKNNQDNTIEEESKFEENDSLDNSEKVIELTKEIENDIISYYIDDDKLNLELPVLWTLVYGKGTDTKLQDITIANYEKVDDYNYYLYVKGRTVDNFGDTQDIVKFTIRVYAIEDSENEKGFDIKWNTVDIDY